MASSSGAAPTALASAHRLLAASRLRAACSAFAPIAAAGTQRAEANVGWAQALSGLGNYEEALQRLEAAIEVDPAFEPAYAALAEMWPRLNEPEAAMARLQRTIDGIQATAAHIAWAGFLMRRDMKEKALDEFDRVAAQGRSDADFTLAWGKTLADAGRHHDALVQYARSIRTAAAGGRTDVDACITAVTRSLRALGIDDSDVADMQAHIDAAGSPEVRLLWAQALFNVKRTSQSAEQLEKAVTALPQSELGWLGWGIVLRDLGENEQAVAKFEKLIELNPRKDAGYSDAAKLIPSLRDPEAAIARIEAIVDASGSAMAHEHWAQALLALNRPAQALAQFDAALAIAPADLKSIGWVNALQSLSRRDDALSGLARAFDITPHLGAPIHDALVELLGAEPSTGPAFARLQREVDALGSPRAHIGWATVLASLGRAQAGVDELHKASARNPGNEAILDGSAAMLASLGRHEDALRQLASALARRSDQDDALLEQTEASLKALTSTARAAGIAIVQAKVDEVTRPDVVLRWANMLAGLKEPAAAIAQFERAATLDPDNPAAHLALAKALAADGKLPRAASAFAALVVASSGAPDPMKDAIEGFKSAFKKLDNDRHLAAFAKAIDAIDGADAYFDWGVALTNLERRGAGIAQMTKSVEKQPPDATRRANYGYFLVGAGKGDQGLAELEAAAEKEPGLAFIQRLWGPSLAQLRRFEDALEKYQRASELGDTDHYFDWALALDGHGEAEAAVEKYREHIRVANAPVQTAYSLHNIAYLREAQGDYGTSSKAWNDAVAAYETAVKSADEDTDDSLFLYSGLVYGGVRRDFESARKRYADALQRQPGNSATHAAVATLYLSWLEQIAFDEKSADLIPQHQSRAREAYGNARRILTRKLADLTSAQALIELGQLHLTFSEHDDANARFTQALELEPESVEARALLAQCCLRSDDLKAALNHAKSAVSREPQNLSYRTVLAETHQKLGELDRAETEYRRVLGSAPGHVDALLGLANTYLAMGAEFQKNGKSSDTENMFSQALDKFSQVTDAAGTVRGSRPLTPAESAALNYSRGYANVARYEAQTVAKRDQKLLDAARAAFEVVPRKDVNFHKAQRAKLKISERMQPTDRPARWGASIIVIGALVTLVVANVGFVFGKPGLARTFHVAQPSVQMLKAAKAPDDVVAKVEALTRREGVPKAAFDAEVKAALGDDLAKKYGETLRQQASSELTGSLQESLEPGYYALLSFGALIFIVAGLYLQQLSKLKFGGFELEKTSETETKVIGSMGISP